MKQALEEEGYRTGILGISGTCLLGKGEREALFPQVSSICGLGRKLLNKCRVKETASRSSNTPLLISGQDQHHPSPKGLSQCFVKWETETRIH